MRKSIRRLLHCFLVGGLSLSCAATLAVPKAAEHEDGEVTFGDAVGAPPKPAAKLATQPVSKAARATRGKGSRAADWQEDRISEASKSRFVLDCQDSAAAEACREGKAQRQGREEIVTVTVVVRFDSEADVTRPNAASVAS
jgi:hypothetical protein